MDSSSDGDEVVQEIPVFVCKSLARKLYVFQYPMRPRRLGWDEAEAVTCKMKPNNRRVRLEFALDADSERFDAAKAERIADDVDGMRFVAAAGSGSKDKDREREAAFPRGRMDRVRYVSSEPSSGAAGKYAVAALRDGELHVTPLAGVLQMRPDREHLEPRRKAAATPGTPAVDEGKNDADEEAAIEAKQITVSFARTETERGRKAREKSYGYLAERSDEEPWCDSSWWRSDSDRAELERSELFADAPSSHVGPARAVPAADYLSSLVPIDRRALPAAADAPSLAERCRALLVAAKVTTVPIASRLTGASGAPLVAALAASGCLLRGGRWAARSALLYPPGSASRHSGVPDDAMRRARDYVLYLFACCTERVERDRVAAAVRLPPDEVDEILASVARRAPGRRGGWEPAAPPDPRFEGAHPDVERRQALFWEARRRRFDEMLSGGGGERPAGKRARHKSRVDSCGSDAGDDGERRGKGTTPKRTAAAGDRRKSVNGFDDDELKSS